MLIETGFAPLEIADRLGHESVKTTLDTYSHLYPDKDQQLADLVVPKRCYHISAGISSASILE